LSKTSFRDAGARRFPAQFVMQTSRLSNPEKVGIRIPAGFAEGTDYTRDGKNLKAGELVLVTR
jgi:hypothetical protein